MVDFEALKAVRNVGFIKDIGFTLTELSEGYAKGELMISDRHDNPIGSIHGGVIFTIADTVGGAAAVSYGRFVTTVSGSINFLRPAMKGCKKLIGESVEIKVGKTMCVYDVIISDDTGREIAKATMTYYYLSLPEAEAAIRLTAPDENR